MPGMATFLRCWAFASNKEKAEKGEGGGEDYRFNLRTIEMNVAMPTAMPTRSETMRNHISTDERVETSEAAVIALTPREPLNAVAPGVSSLCRAWIRARIR